jgi:hypothetical protein
MLPVKLIMRGVVNVVIEKMLNDFWDCITGLSKCVTVVLYFD